MGTDLELDPRSEILRAQVAGLGYRALATAHELASALPLAPTLVVKKALVEYVREELERFQSASMLYAEVTQGDDLHAAVGERLADVPRPESWLEVVIMQLLFDRAGKIQLEETAGSSDARIARLASDILAGERMHGVMSGEAGNALRNMLHAEPERRDEAQRHVERWLVVSLRSFGRPGSERGKQALELGLKRRDSGDVVRDYLEAIAPILAACDLALPDVDSLGLDR